MKSLSKYPFSLIELLVVISILAILASLLSPTLKRTIESAYQVECSSNQKNLAISLHLYADDHSDLFVPIHQTNSDNRLENWKTSLTKAQYTDKDNLALTCPSQRERSSYGMNMESFPSGSFRSTIDRPIMRYRIEEPSTKVQAGDATSTIFYRNRSNPEGSRGWLNFEESAFRTVAYRHVEKCNLIFFDGHSESIDMRVFWNKVNDYLTFQKDAIKMD